jgi:hypothetical protein
MIGRICELGRSCSVRAIATLLLAVAGHAASAQSDQSDKTTIINFQFTERHDRLTPDVERDIEWTNDFTVTLAGKNKVSENQSVVFRGSPLHPATGERVIRLSHTDERDTALGDEAKTFIWQVLGPKKLRRIYTGTQFALVIDLEIDQRNSCHVNVKYLKQTGFVDVVMKRTATGTMEHFTLPRVVSASCSIQSS